MKQRILKLLGEMIACDTQNPPRAITADGKLLDLVRNRLGDGFQFQLTDHDKGRIALLATRGDPRTLFNVHLDTVPAGDAWTHPPLVLSVDGDRALGRGACDIKGAAACLIAAATSTGTDVAILFTTDEEGAESCCVSAFCQSPAAAQFRRVIVAEPTGCRAVIGHRGYLSVTGRFAGNAGHSSQHDLLAGSANHRAARWVADAIEAVGNLEAAELDGRAACFNVGRIDGGIKNNVIADQCLVTWSARMPAGCENTLILRRLTEPSAEYVQWETSYHGQPLPTSPAARSLAEAVCARLHLPVGEDVDFYTEAAIFSEAGLVSVVLGPGNIAQAHTPDEWVSIKQLELCTDIYARLMSGPH